MLGGALLVVLEASALSQCLTGEAFDALRGGVGSREIVVLRLASKLAEEETGDQAARCFYLGALEETGAKR